MKVYSHTDIGNRRKENQDSLSEAMLDGAVFAVVCDGMGGTNAGREASMRAVNIIRERVVKGYREGLDSIGVRNLLVAAVITANSVIFELGGNVPEWNGMGTTCVCALVRGNTVYMVNVGDSRGYLITNESVTQVTKDHSMVMRLYEQGDITKEELKNHPKRNIITRAIGAEENVIPDYFECDFHEGDAVLLCTDGLSNYCEEDTMLSLMRELPPEEVPSALVNNALENNSSDNITAVIIK